MCDPRPNRRNDVIWTDDPSTIEPIVRVAHSVSINAFGAFSASGKSPLFFFSENLTAPLYVSILESTVLPAVGFLADTGPFYKTAIQRHCKIDARLVARPCARIYHAGAVATALTRPQPHRERLGIGGEPSLAAPTKNARGVETCSAEVMAEEYCTTLADSMGARLRKLRKLRGAHTGY